MTLVARLQRLLALRGSEPVALVALIAANLVPLVGALFFGWSVWSVLILYWVENGIVGVLNLARMALARGGPPQPAGGWSKAGIMAFFAFHYGIFWVVHGGFVFALPAFAPSVEQGFGRFEPDVVVIGAIALAASHVTSFVRNYIGGREYMTATVEGLMFRPYARVVTLHVTIIIGAVAIADMGSPIALLALLILLKTGFDLVLHLREHRPRPGVSAAA